MGNKYVYTRRNRTLLTSKITTMKECYHTIVNRWCEHQIKVINEQRNKYKISIIDISNELDEPYTNIQQILKGTYKDIKKLIAVKMYVWHTVWQKEPDELPF